jgi:hypothetical protein
MGGGFNRSTQHIDVRRAFCSLVFSLVVHSTVEPQHQAWLATRSRDPSLWESTAAAAGWYFHSSHVARACVDHRNKLDIRGEREVSVLGHFAIPRRICSAVAPCSKSMAKESIICCKGNITYGWMFRVAQSRIRSRSAYTLPSVSEYLRDSLVRLRRVVGSALCGSS